MRFFPGVVCNSRYTRILVILTVALTVFVKPTLCSRSRAASGVKQYGQLPLSFEANRGQADPNVRFLYRGSGLSVLLGDKSISFVLHTSDRPRPQGKPEAGRQDDAKQDADLVKMELEGSSSNASVSGEQKLPGIVNYLIGSDPKRWRTSIPTFSQIRYAQVYRGVDLTYYGNQRQFEYDFLLAPGADAGSIRLRFDGARKMALDPAGNLVIRTPHGSIAFHKPVVYQKIDGHRRQIAGYFRLLPRNIAGFSIGKYDREKPLTIDPVLTYSTYLNGSRGSGADGLAVDSAGNAYIAGWTNSADFPTTSGALQRTNAAGQGQNAFVAKLNSTGTALIYSTYIGGSGTDEARAIALDGNGNAYVGGVTTSDNFPTTSGAFQGTKQTPAGITTCFVAKLNSSGTGLLYSTYLGGSQTGFPTSTDQDFLNSVAIDASGDAFVGGETLSTDFPTTAGALQTTNPSAAISHSAAAFITKLNPAGSALVYSTYLGGVQGASIGQMAIDTAGNAYIGGGASSPDFPVTPGAYQSTFPSSASAGYIAKLNPQGTALLYSTFLAGSADNEIHGIALNSAGEVYVAGSTNSKDFPTTPGVIQSKIVGGGASLFVAKLNATASALEYSTLLGGTYNGLGGGGDDNATSIAIDSAGDAYVAGQTYSLDFPTTPTAFQSVNTAGLNEAEASGLVIKINPTGTVLLYSTLLAGSGDQYDDGYMECDCLNSLQIDSAENVYLAGEVVSLDFPTTPVAFQAYSGNRLRDDNAIVVKLTGDELRTLPGSATTLSSSANPAIRQQNLTLTASVQPTSGGGGVTGTVAFSTINGILKSVPLDSSGNAVFAINSLPLGKYPITAIYSGDAAHGPSRDDLVQEIDGIPTKTTVVADKTSAVYGTPITFNIRVTPLSGSGIPTGLVLFGTGGGANYVQLDGSGDATSTAATIPVGTHTMQAMYVNDANYAQSTGTTQVTISPIGAAATPIFSPSSGTYSQPQAVTLSSSQPGSQIVYTTDGSAPTSSSIPYVNPIYVQQSETIKAIAMAMGYSVSPVASATYSISNLAAPDFGVSVSPDAITSTQGNFATVAVTVASVNGFSQPVSLGCSGLPAGFACSFSPAVVAPNAAGVKSSLTVTQSASNAAKTSKPRQQIAGMTGAMVGLLLICIQRKRKWSSRIACLLLLAGAVVIPTACGTGGGSSSVAPPVLTNTTIEVIGSSGSLQHSAPLSISH